MAKKITVTLEIPPEDAEKFKIALRQKDVQEACTTVVQQAFNQFRAWMFGVKRYRTMTEQYIDWIDCLYSTALPEERPEVERLYNDFNVPYGQAAYICRVLEEKSVDRWRQAARQQLREALDAVQQDADAKAKSAAGVVGSLSVSIEVDRHAYRELVMICDELKSGDRSFLLPSFSQSFGRTRKCTIPVQSVKKIRSAMEA